MFEISFSFKFRYTESEVVNSLLVRKYNQPVPRYTGYPTKEEQMIREIHLGVAFFSEDESGTLSNRGHLLFIPD